MKEMNRLFLNLPQNIKYNQTMYSKLILVYEGTSQFQTPCQKASPSLHSLISDLRTLAASYDRRSLRTVYTYAELLVTNRQYYRNRNSRSYTLRYTLNNRFSGYYNNSKSSSNNYKQLLQGQKDKGATKYQVYRKEGYKSQIYKGESKDTIKAKILRYL